MAHNLATISGKTAMAYQGETPWHKLGVRLPSMTSVAEALAASHTDYTVRAEPLYLADGTPVTMRKAIVRDGENVILSTVGDGYEIMQHVDGFGALDVLCTEYGMTIESAGALGDGERVWMLFKMPDDTTIAPVDGDDIRGYMLATTGHDGSWSYQLRGTGIRVVCQNTLDLASTSGVDFVRLFHTKGNADKLKIAADIVSRIVKSFTETGETFASFARRELSDAEVIQYVETLFPVDAVKPSDSMLNRRRTVADLIWTGVGSDMARSSTNGAPNVWAAYNAVTEYFDHVRPGEAKSDAGRERANVSAIFGSAADIKLRALSLSRQLVAA